MVRCARAAGMRLYAHTQRGKLVLASQETGKHSRQAVQHLYRCCAGARILAVRLLAVVPLKATATHVCCFCPLSTAVRCARGCRIHTVNSKRLPLTHHVCCSPATCAKLSARKVLTSAGVSDANNRFTRAVRHVLESSEVSPPLLVLPMLTLVLTLSLLLLTGCCCPCPAARAAGQVNVLFSADRASLTGAGSGLGRSSHLSCKA